MAGDRIARGLLFLTNHPALFVATALVGNSVANYMISLAAVIAMGQAVSPARKRPRSWPRSSWLRSCWSMASCCRRICSSRPPTACCGAAGRCSCSSSCSSFPWPACSGCWADCWPAPTRTSHEPIRLVLAQRELRRILAEGHEAGILHPAQQSLAHGILAVARKPVRQFLTPPGHMVQVRADMSKQAVLALAERNHTAVIPVADGLRPAGRIRAGRRFASARRRRSGPHSSLARGP